MRLYIKFTAEIDLLPRTWKQTCILGRVTTGRNYKWLFILICYRNGK
jgi:hypothetical protein